MCVALSPPQPRDTLSCAQHISLLETKTLDHTLARASLPTVPACNKALFAKAADRHETRKTLGNVSVEGETLQM